MNDLTVQKRAPEVIVAEIWTLNRSQLVNWIETGRKLCELKESVPYGEFGKWVKEAGYSTTKANNLMRLYTEFGAAQGNLFGTDVEDFQTYGKLQYSQAVALLDIPSEERAEFMETHNVEAMSVRELQKAIRERDEAKAAAEYSEKKLDELSRAFDESQTALEDEKARTLELNTKIKDLESRPIEVAVQVDEDAVKKAADEARAAAEAEWSAKVKAAEDKLAKAEEKAKKAAEKAKTAGADASKEAAAELDEARQAKANAEAEAEQLRAELEAAKREQAKASIAGDADLAAFQLLFEQVQADVNKMRGLLLKVRGREDSDLGEKLAKALLALADAVKECAA